MWANRSRACCTADATWAGLVTSRATASTRSGADSARPATVAASRAVTTALWPAPMTASASARPSPVEHPVMSHVDMRIPASLSKSRAVESITSDEFCDRPAAQPGQLPHRFPERHDGGDRVQLGDAQQLADVFFGRDGHRRDGAAVALASRGEQDVPNQRIHRRPTGDADAVQMLID